MSSKMAQPSLPETSGQGRVAATHYRLGQFGRGLQALLRPSLRSSALTEAENLLPAAAFSLFGTLPADAQRHSLLVLQSIADEEPPNADLAIAALLHDVGKVAAAQAGAPIGIWLRGPMVIGEAIAPRRMAQAARNDLSSGWRYTLWVQRHHPEIGAAMARAAGCSARTCWLIGHHADARPIAAQAPLDATGALPDNALLDDLRLLQQADNRN